MSIPLASFDPSGAHSMAEAPVPTLIEELDARQDEVLLALEALNERIEAALRGTLAWRQQHGLIPDEVSRAA
jgi:hypothetical protein